MNNLNVTLPDGYWPANLREVPPEGVNSCGFYYACSGFYGIRDKMVFCGPSDMKVNEADPNSPSFADRDAECWRACFMALKEAGHKEALVGWFLYANPGAAVLLVGLKEGEGYRPAWELMKENLGYNEAGGPEEMYSVEDMAKRNRCAVASLDLYGAMTDPYTDATGACILDIDVALKLIENPVDFLTPEFMKPLDDIWESEK